MAFKQDLIISPYRPDRTYSLGDNTGQFSDADIGKAVKQNTGGYLELCGAQDEIFGIVTSVEPYTKDGHSIGSVACDSGARAYITDNAGSMAIGNNVVAVAQTALGTADTHGAQVAVRATPAVGDMHLWTVIEITTGAAASKILIEKL